MKKMICLGFLVLVVFGFTTTVFAQDENKPGMQIGLAFPTVGWHAFNDEGEIKNVSGINIGLGYSWKTFPDGLTPGEFNFFWGWGTIVLIVPYLEVGVRYPIEMNDDATNLLNIDFGLFYLAPYIGISASF